MERFQYLRERKTIKFASKPENINLVVQFSECMRSEITLHDEIYYEILLLLTEATNNAIIHGNKMDEQKNVEVSYWLDERGKTLSFMVKDEGPGFGYMNLPDPTAPENLEKSHGRGVFLIMQLAHIVVFSNNGATIEVQFKI